MEVNKKDNSFTEGLLLICAIAIAASMVQIGFLLAPMSERAADINQCVKERTAYWMKNDKNLARTQNRDSHPGAMAEDVADEDHSHRLSTSNKPNLS